MWPWAANSSISPITYRKAMRNDTGDAPKQESDAINGRDWILAVDTSTPEGGVALFHLYTKKVRTKRLPAGIRTSRILLPAIRDLMREANAREESIAAVGVALGPGSFTGLRIGLATAKGLVIGLRCPLFGISSLDALADAALRSWLNEGGTLPEWVLPCRDARNGELFSALYKPAKVQPDGAPTAVRAGEDILSRRNFLPLPENGKILIVAAEKDFPVGIIGGDSGSRILHRGVTISPESVARLAWQAMTQGRSSAVADLQPIYGRKPRAETLWPSFET
ncbi:MAG TPA: tRNA (adenosine(37)-N6)-threonylcarbamoyltransferase complex dimerization subunit type 1 TsaB [Nitrospinae bacterium]|nr:tRNA (adenosine(37)-N6)-threonylcarbamoyltransferase complex dimerization subunit type 1 TsaB [Nitrospinota bacterium]